MAETQWMQQESAKKQSTEKVTFGFDLSGAIASGVTISGTPTAKIYDSSGSDCSEAMIQATTIAGNIVSVQTKAGTSGSSYKITITANLSNGDIFEFDKTLIVEDL